MRWDFNKNYSEHFWRAGAVPNIGETQSNGF
jgi:hypothetical protein